MRYLLDSDIVIDYLRNYQPTMGSLDGLLKPGDDLFISAITNLELHVGDVYHQSRNFGKNQQLLFSSVNRGNQR